MIFIHKATLTPLEIEKRIEIDAKAIKLMMKKHFPFSQNLAENGFTINEYASVFELCKAPIAAKLLNTQPELNVLMPCRISVYQKDKITFVSTPNLSAQLDMLVCNDELKEEILKLYNDIVSLIKKY